MVIFNLPPEVEERLQKNAAEAGLTPEQYLIALLERPVVPQRRMVAGGNAADSPFSEAEPRNPVDPSRQMDYSSSSTIVRQGSSPVRSQLLTRLNAEMDPGEEILWTGAPIHRRALKSPMVITALICAVMAIGFIAPSVILADPSWLIGSGFFVFLGGMFGGCYCSVARANARTIYGVSNRRALILGAGRELTLRSIQPREIGEISRTEFLDGTGRVRFARKKVTFFDHPPEHPVAVFNGIPEVRSVERLLRALSKTPPE